MNFLKRLFFLSSVEEIRGKELIKLMLSLGENKKNVRDLLAPHINYPKNYIPHPYGEMDVKSLKDKVSFELEVTPAYFNRSEIYTPDKWRYGSTFSIKKTLPYEEAIKNPVLKKYVKGKFLEKSLAVLSAASILASAFFISNNITGNAILANNANSSGIIGAGLFVLGLVSWIFARKI